MIKKSLAALAVVGILTLGGASAASATYAGGASCSANPNPIVVGAVSVISCEGLAANTTGTIAVQGQGVTDETLSSIVFAAGGVGSDSVTKTTSATGTVSVNFKGPAAGNYTVTLTTPTQTVSTTVTVTAASTGGGSGLPATGGTVPAAAIWLGVGAIGIGGIAIAAAVARRRARADSSN